MFAGSKSRTLTLVAPLAAVLVLVPAALRALPGRDCLVDYANCVDAASELDSFPKRSFAGLRCFVDFISCLQRRLA